MALLIGAIQLQASVPGPPVRETHIRAGRAGTIVAVKRPTTISRTARGASDYPHPRPRLAGFSPWIAITTSDEGHPLGYDLEFEHDLQSSFAGSPLNPYVQTSFVIGLLDSGSDVDLAAGTFADTLGFYGANLTSSTIPIGGVGGSVDAYITMPVGFFAAGLSAIGGGGALDYGALVGHSNVCGLAAPAIDCGNGEVLSAVVGMPFMAFYNSVIRVDTPHTVTVSGVTYKGPDVQIQDPFDPLPTYTHLISLEFGGLSTLATTANYYPNFEDLETPILPTLLSIMPGTIPFGGTFFADILVREGPAGPDNPAQSIRVLVDTGAQSSIIGPAVAAALSLPFSPDFAVDVCGAGGLVEDVPGYFVDYVKINAFGGALEFSRAPVVLLDLLGPEGTPLDGILGMNFFWNRNVIFEPSLTSSSFFHVSESIPVPFGDTDVDFDVDDDDAAVFLACLTGASAPGDPLVSPDCDHLDADFDGDVDLTDFARFQACFSGADLTADPLCGE